MPSPDEILRQKLDMIPDEMKDIISGIGSRLAEITSAHISDPLQRVHYDDYAPFAAKDETGNIVDEYRPLMTLNGYQSEAMTFDRVTGCPRLMYAALGLNEEAGEVAGKVKKAYRDNGGKITEETKEAIAYELGDVLWYVVMTAQEIGYDLDDIAKMNINKLTSRRKRGVIGGSGDNR